MGYRKAVKILPPEVVALIQQYVDGEYIYIPRKEENRKSWGESTDYRREMEERNRKTYADYKNGMNTEMLPANISFQIRASRGLLRMKKENKHRKRIPQPFAGGNPFSHSFFLKIGEE